MLADIKVLDLTHYVAGPYCARMLGGLGAEVIKIERPDGGDPARRIGPFYHDHPHPEKSALFLHLNVNKLGVTLNLKSPPGIGILRELVKDADLVVESFRPGVMDRLGLSFDALREVNPGLVMASISNFGQSGPYRDFKASELGLFGMGPLHATGAYAEGPVKLGGRVVQYQAGAVAAMLITMGLYARGRGTDPGHIDVSIMETQAGNIDRWIPYLMAFAYTGEVTARTELGIAWDVGVYPCRDGYVNLLHPFGRRGIGRFLELIERSELQEDPRFATSEQRNRPEHSSALLEYFLEWAIDRPMATVASRAQAMGILAAPVYSPAALLKDPHYRARAAWITAEHPYSSPLTYPGRSMVMSGTPWQLTRPAPLLGQHNQEVFCGRLGFSRRDIERLRQLEVV